MGWLLTVRSPSDKNETIANYHRTGIASKLPGYWEPSKQWHNHHVGTVIREIRTALDRLDKDEPEGWGEYSIILKDLKWILLNDIPLDALCIFDDHDGCEDYHCDDVKSEYGDVQSESQLVKDTPEIPYVEHKTAENITFVEKVYDMLKKQEKLLDSQSDINLRELKFRDREARMIKYEKKLQEREKALDEREKMLAEREKAMYDMMVKHGGAVDQQDKVDKLVAYHSSVASLEYEVKSREEKLSRDIDDFAKAKVKFAIEVDYRGHCEYEYQIRDNEIIKMKEIISMLKLKIEDAHKLMDCVMSTTNIEDAKDLLKHVMLIMNVLKFQIDKVQERCSVENKRIIFSELVKSEFAIDNEDLDEDIPDADKVAKAE